MAGNPTLTTDPSMKARLEARMVVANIQRECATGIAGACEAMAIERSHSGDVTSDRDSGTDAPIARPPNPRRPPRQLV